jgi:ArsR family transcriptional regulator
MGATKIEHYSKETIQLAKLANALGHPARITIVKILKENPYFRNVEFQSILKLSQTAVHSHLLKLKTANIIDFNYFPHEYHVHLITENLDELNYFIRD